MTVELEAFIERMESTRNGRYRRKIGRSERLFLINVWGPLMDGRYDGLRAEYPLKDFKDGERFVDFVFEHRGVRLLIEIDGFTTHARNISPGEFNDHLERQNDLVIQGWSILRFTADAVEKKPMQCRRKIEQLIGHWWAVANRTIDKESADIWHHRRSVATQLAARKSGYLYLEDLMNHFQVCRRTALNWMNRFVRTGAFDPVRPNKRVIGYSLRKARDTEGL